MKRLVIASAIVMAMAQSAYAQSAYYVYCAGGRIVVDGRDPDQMRIARGSGTCVMGQFSLRSDAENFARRNFGGIGSSCSCR